MSAAENRKPAGPPAEGRLLGRGRPRGKLRPGDRNPVPDLDGSIEDPLGDFSEQTGALFG